MMCPVCGGFMIQHYLEVMICLKCGNKEMATNDQKN